MTTVLLVLVLLQARTAPAGELPLGTAEVHGRVTETDTGRPIPRARVQLTLEGAPGLFNTPTDDDGRYRLTGLPAGVYFSSVEGPAFRATYLASTLRTVNRRITIAQGEVLKDMNATLARARAITVHVVDEWGEPLTGFQVRVRDSRTRQNVYAWRRRSTDDRGRIRIYGLDRGTYTLCAEHELGSAALSQTPTPARDRFLPTCYPSAAGLDEATPVSLESSDLGGIEIRMRRGRSFRISGVVLDSSGAPTDRAWVSLEQFDMNRSSGSGVRLMPGGRFVLENVAPGDYAISARLGGPDRPEQRSPLEVGFVAVSIDASDVENLVVTMTRTVDVAGRFVLEDPSQRLPKPDGSGLMVSARLAGDGLKGTGSSVFARADEQREFTLTGMFGRRTFDIANVPRGWFVKAIRYRDKDITDLATELAANRDPSAFEVVLSAKGAMIAGRVLDDRGEPVRAAQIVMVPADRSRWGRFDAVAGRSSATGQFRIGPRRAGEYIVLALIEGAQILEPGDVEQLEKVVARGERVTLGTEGEVTVDLQVIRPER